MPGHLTRSPRHIYCLTLLLLIAARLLVLVRHPSSAQAQSARPNTAPTFNPLPAQPTPAWDDRFIRHPRLSGRLRALGATDQYTEHCQR